MPNQFMSNRLDIIHSGICELGTSTNPRMQVEQRTGLKPIGQPNGEMTATVLSRNQAVTSEAPYARFRPDAIALTASNPGGLVYFVRGDKFFAALDGVDQKRLMQRVGYIHRRPGGSVYGPPRSFVERDGPTGRLTFVWDFDNLANPDDFARYIRDQLRGYCVVALETLPLTPDSMVLLDAKNLLYGVGGNSNVSIAKQWLCL